MMQSAIFFGSPICKVDDIVDEDYNSQIIERLVEIQGANPEPRQSWVCDVYTSHNMFDLQQDDLFTPLLTRQAELVYEFANGFTNEKHKAATLLNSWFNISKKHQYQDQHIHTNSHISTVYYAKAPEGSAATIFKSPVIDMCSFGSSFQNEVSIPPKERSLVMFCSNTPHLTGQQTIDETRITVASNFKIGG